MSKLRSLKMGIGILGVLALSAVPLTAFAQEIGTTAVEVESELTVGYVGILSIDGSQYTIQPKEGDAVTFTLSADAVLRLPPEGLVDASALQDGQKIAVLTEAQADGSLVGTRLMIQPDQPVTDHVSGAVVAIDGNVVTILTPDGEERQVTLPEQALAGIEIGEPLTAVTERQGGRETGAAHGRGTVTSADVRERLQGHATELERRGQSGELDADEVAARLENVQGLIETNRVRVADVLQKAMARVPEQAKARIQSAMDRASAGFDRAAGAVTDARSRTAGRPADAGTDAGRPEASSSPTGADAAADRRP